VSPPTQLSGCPSQISTVPELLRAHSDGVVDSIVNVSHSPYVNIQYWYPINFWFRMNSRFNYSFTIQFLPDHDNPHPIHTYYEAMMQSPLTTCAHMGLLLWNGTHKSRCTTRTAATRPTQPSIPLWLVNEDRLSLRRQRQLWVIGSCGNASLSRRNSVIL